MQLIFWKDPAAAAKAKSLNLIEILLRLIVTIVIRKTILQENAKSLKAKKLVLVSATSASVIGASEEA